MYEFYLYGGEGVYMYIEYICVIFICYWPYFSYYNSVAVNQRLES